MTSIIFPESLGRQAIASVGEHTDSHLVSLWLDEIRGRGLDPTDDLVLARDLQAAWEVLMLGRDTCSPAALAVLKAWLQLLRTGELCMFEQPETLFAPTEANWIGDIDFPRSVLTIRGKAQHLLFVLPPAWKEFWADVVAFEEAAAIDGLAPACDLGGVLVENDLDRAHVENIEFWHWKVQQLGGATDPAIADEIARVAGRARRRLEAAIEVMTSPAAVPADIVNGDKSTGEPPHARRSANKPRPKPASAGKVTEFEKRVEKKHVEWTTKPLPLRWPSVAAECNRGLRLTKAQIRTSKIKLKETGLIPVQWETHGRAPASERLIHPKFLNS